MFLYPVKPNASIELSWLTVKVLAPLTPRFLTSKIGWVLDGLVEEIPATSSKRPTNVSPNSASTLNVGVNVLLVNWIASGSSTHLDGRTLKLPLISVGALISSAPPYSYASDLRANATEMHKPATRALLMAATNKASYKRNGCCWRMCSMWRRWPCWGNGRKK